MNSILRKELTMAKNIIKNPILLKRADRDLNFNRVEVYPFKDVHKELNVNTESKTKYKKFFESFNLNNETISKTSMTIRPKDKPSIYTNRSASMQQNYPIKNTISPRSNFTSFVNNRNICTRDETFILNKMSLTSNTIISPHSIRGKLQTFSKIPLTPSKFGLRANSIDARIGD